LSYWGYRWRIYRPSRPTFLVRHGFSGENEFVEFAKKPFATNENGGIHGEVIYASTRPFDDPGLLIHTSWTPDVPGVTVNLYQEGFAADGVTPTLKLVDTTKTSSWDDWAQGFYSNTPGAPGFNKPYMNCPGQFPAPTSTAPGDLFFFSLFNQPNWLDQYNNGGVAAHTIPNNSQFKCYDGMHSWNQVQPAPFDGMYAFPSVTSLDPNTGKPAGTNCTICNPNPDTTDPYRSGTPMLPAGKYVVEMIVPPGYELVKEEDKNILIGDNYIAPVTQEFAGLGSAIYPTKPKSALTLALATRTPAQPHATSSNRPSLWDVPHCPAMRVTRAAWRRSGHAWVSCAWFPTTSACIRSRTKWPRLLERCAIFAIARKSSSMIRPRPWRSSGSSPRLTLLRTTPV
jgi:hypothetical protein